DEKITRVEFDYAYNKAVNDYLATEEYEYMQYYGYNLTGDLSKQAFSEYLTWEDVFEEQAVMALAEKHAMIDMAAEEGFTFNTDEKFQQFEDSMQYVASTAEMTVDKYLRYAYGGYANKKRLEPFVREDIFIEAYYAHLKKNAEPTEEAINAYYEENKLSLDLVDYRIISVSAEVTKESNADEIANAMTAAEKMAENLLTTIDTESDLCENQGINDMDSAISDWLYSADRKTGDTTVIVDDTTHKCHAIAFESRHKDERTTADIRMMIVDIAEGENLFNEWKNGEATEETFAEMCKEHSWDNLASEGGLTEDVAAGVYKAEIDEWVFAEGRTYGDATFIEDEEMQVTYVLYFVSEARPAWENSIIAILASDVVYEQIHAVSDTYEIGDSKNKLGYIEGMAAESAAAALAETTE
ncbi:MAG: hypothetical protein IKY38_00590, partial [Anaerotignum sp.]|nr:hypothetical protein [Anaerotignum sp.]